MKKLYRALVTGGHLFAWLGATVIAGVLAFLGALLDGRGGAQ